MHCGMPITVAVNLMTPLPHAGHPALSVEYVEPLVGILHCAASYMHANALAQGTDESPAVRVRAPLRCV